MKRRWNMKWTLGLWSGLHGLGFPKTRGGSSGPGVGVEFGDQGLGFSVWVLRLGFEGTTLVYSIYTSSCA